MQPTHCTADLELADEIIGPRRLASYAWRSFLDARVRVAFGSDAPVEDPNPFFGLHAAVTRQRADGQPIGGWRPEERVTLDEAVHAFTVAAHESVGRTDVGRLVPGQLADLVAVDRDLWSLEESRRPTSVTPWCSRPGSAATSPSSGPEPPGIRPRATPTTVGRQRRATRGHDTRRTRSGPTNGRRSADSAPTAQEITAPLEILPLGRATQDQATHYCWNMACTDDTLMTSQSSRTSSS